MRIALLPWLLLAVLAPLGCTPTHQGRLLVTVSTDLAIPAELARVEVSTPLATQSFDPPLPFSFVVAASSDREPGAEVTITARGYAPDGALVVTRTIRTSFIANRTLIVPLVLPRLCSAVGCAMPPPCPSGSVCTERGCGSERVEPADLDEARAPGEEIDQSPDAGPPIGLDPIPAERFCDELAGLQCDAVLNCCPALTPAEREAARPGCVARVLMQPRGCRQIIEPIVSDPRTAYDPVRAASVFAEGRRLVDPLVCSLAFVDWYASSGEGAFSVMRGTVLPGQDCTPTSNDDIAALFSCAASSCQLRESSTFTCAQRGCFEEPCVGGNACADGLYCTSDDIEMPGTCAVRLPFRASCTDDAQCESYLCNEQRDASGELTEPGTCQARTAQNVFCPAGLTDM